MAQVDQRALAARRNGDVMLVRDVPPGQDVEAVREAVEAAGWVLASTKQRGLFKKATVLYFAAAE
ncbi:hypothetical protein ABII15_03750 [Streptomyces sp. HUAS MG91]|uniref:Uncharacterized protein n=1 Tax=Streptomyces tabacisoli TaxID=3156398 RepID=A0AAU8ILI5_9ACTN